MKKFPFVKQHDAMDCGPACLSMISKFYGRRYSMEFLKERSFVTRSGVSLLGISKAAESIGMRTVGLKIGFDKLKDSKLPCIVHWNQNHFAVVYKISSDKVYISDPAHGLLVYSKEEFLKSWISTKSNEELLGICMLVEPTPDFFNKENEKQEKSGFKYLFSYLRSYKKYIIQLFLGLLLGSLIQLIFPFLTQALVDKGINNSDIGFIYLVLIAQLVLFLSQASVEFIRGWIILHLSTRINISLISDFLIKLLKLPIGFFDSKKIGDIMQRIDDHKRIESFLTTSTLNIIFSMLNLIIFGIVLLLYNSTIFTIFIIGTIIYILWVLIFMKKRRDIDYKRFNQLSLNQSNLFQLITGIHEIKLNNCERQKRWEWERIQAKLFRVNVKSLALNQYQQSGSILIDQTKNILISFTAAYSVVNGEMTLGMMLAVQYIIGQLNGPVTQMVGFIHTMQDAKISLERMGEIHSKEDEDELDNMKISKIPFDNPLNLNDVTFHYSGPHSEKVLDNLNLEIPQNKVTAIVGASGSGKTTLIKLLLGFYPPTSGDIKIGNIYLKNIRNDLWRSKCGVVMQDGFVFSDTIANNIALGEDQVETKRLMNAAENANISEFISVLPLGFNTKIGSEGHGLSQGQRQRILIARAMYKDPEILFLDEATNALDANNERVIVENINKFFKDKTMVVVAHRLSTVKNADQIVVLDKGKIIEKGKHDDLVKQKGSYFKLVKNQLELGS